MDVGSAVYAGAINCHPCRLDLLFPEQDILLENRHNHFVVVSGVGGVVRYKIINILSLLRVLCASVVNMFLVFLLNKKNYGIKFFIRVR